LEANFNACSLSQGSTFSTFVKLNQSYENTCFVFDYRVDAHRLPRLPIAEEGRGDNVHGRNDDARNIDLGQEEFDDEEDFDVGFDRSVAICVAEEDREEEGRS